MTEMPRRRALARRRCACRIRRKNRGDQRFTRTLLYGKNVDRAAKSKARVGLGRCHVLDRLCS